MRLAALALCFPWPATAPVQSAVVLERVDFRSLALEDACRLLADASGLNIVPTESASRRPVSLYVRDLAIAEVLEALCRKHGLWLDTSQAGGVLTVATVEEYRRDLATVQEEKTEFFTLLFPNVFDVGYAIRNLFGDRVVLRAGDADSDLLLDLSDRLARFDLFDARTQGFGRTSLGSRSSGLGAALGAFGDNGFTGGGASAFRAAGRSGLGNEFGEIRDEDADQAPLRRDDRDELDSARILEIERLRALEGLDPQARERLLSVVAESYRAPIHVTVARRQNKLIVRTGDERAMEQIRDLVRELDVPTALVLLEVRILAVDLFDGISSFFEYQWADGDYAGEFTTGAIGAPTPPALGPPGTGLISGNLIFQFVNDSFAARMQALERDNRVRTLSTPILLTANNEVSRLFVGREVPLNRSFSGGSIITNESTTSSVSGTTDIEFRPVGTTILLTPNINADRTVTLKILQETSNVDSTAEVLVPAADSFTQQSVNVVSSQSVSGTIVAKSAYAIAFGGLIEERKERTVAQVPFLGDIPLLGKLFRRESDSESRTEIVIVVRPYVLGTPAEFQAASRQLLEAVGSDLSGSPLAEPLPTFEIEGLTPRRP